MGRPRQTNNGGYIIPLRRPPLFAALFFILLTRISFLLPLLNVSPPCQSPTTMAITTRAKKAAPISQGSAATATTPAERQSKQLSRSPHTNVNILLADINRPTAHADSVLQVLQPRYITTDDPNANLKKGSLMTAPDSPTGADSHEDAPTAIDGDAEPRNDPTTSIPQPP